MSPEIESPVPATPPATGDSIGYGCLYGCICQIAFFVLGMLGAFVAKGKTSDVMAVIWGATQWIGLIPLILSQRKKGHHKTVIGLILTGGLGVLLSSACASMVLNMSFR